MKSRLLCVVLCSIFVQQVYAQARLVEDSLYVASLRSVKKYRVLLPAERKEQEKLPGLLLLHGFGGNYGNWTDLTKVQDAAAPLKIVIIMPDGNNSWYVNSATDTAARYEEYILQDVLPALCAKYGVDTGKLGVAGLSMGGYGSLVLGLRHPKVFRFIGALSASLDIPFGIPMLEQYGRSGLRASLLETFGTDTLRWREHSPQRLLAGLDSADVPYIYLANGIQDEFAQRLDYYREYAVQLSARKLPYEYHETPGRHSWEYWGREIPPVLVRFLDVVSRLK